MCIIEHVATCSADHVWGPLPYPDVRSHKLVYLPDVYPTSSREPCILVLVVILMHTAGCTVVLSYAVFHGVYTGNSMDPWSSGMLFNWSTIHMCE